MILLKCSPDSGELPYTSMPPRGVRRATSESLAKLIMNLFFEKSISIDYSNLKLCVWEIDDGSVLFTDRYSYSILII